MPMKQAQHTLTYYSNSCTHVWTPSDCLTRVAMRRLFNLCCYGKTIVFLFSETTFYIYKITRAYNMHTYIHVCMQAQP